MMQKLFDSVPEEVILSVEETFNMKKQVKNSDELLTALTTLIGSVRKDVGLGLTNPVLFNVNPYSKHILEIDKILSKTYGLIVKHVPADNTYSGYIKDSYLKDSLVKAIFDKNKDNILSDIKDDIPKVTNNKAKGKREQGLTVFVKADFYDLIVNHEISNDDLLRVVLSEMRAVLGELENMNSLLNDGIAMRKTILKGGLEELYVKTLNGSTDDLEGKSGTKKIKLVIDAILNKYSVNGIHKCNFNPYHNTVGNEANEDGRTEIPVGTRILYLLLLIIIITIIITIAAAGLANFIAIGYALIAYVIYSIFYAIYRVLHIIVVGTDPKEVPEKPNTVVIVKELLSTGNTEAINNADKDMNKSNNNTIKTFGKISGMYNGKLSTEMMVISNESVFDENTMNKLLEGK